MKRLVLLFCLLPLLAPGQSSIRFSRGDSLKFIIECRNAFELYITHLNGIVTDAPSPGEALFFQQTVNKEHFLSDSVRVYDDVAEREGEQYPATEYLGQFYNKRAVLTVPFGKESYRLGRTPAGKLELVTYVEQSVEFGKVLKARIKRKNLIGVHFVFSVFAGNSGYEPKDFRIALIERIKAIPAGLAPFPTSINLDSIRARERDLSWMAHRVARAIREKLPANIKTVYLTKFSYENSNITNPFSDELMSALSFRLRTDEGLTVEPASSAQGVGVRGAYRQKADYVEVTAEIYDISTDKSLVALKPNTDLPMNWVYEKGLKLKPEGNDQAITTQQKLNEGAPPSPPGPPKPDALKIQLATSAKVGKHIEFWQNDTLYVKVRVNKPCHVRLLYIQADGSPSLLWNDYEIKPGQENQDIWFPEPFVCVPPYGQETLIAVAANNSFCPVSTKQNIYGVDVLEGSLNDALKSVRCTSRAVGRVPQQAETRLVVTTRSTDVAKK
ncbi:hypothetical protein [Spirosoma fluviale]|uniref:DUF4384 domain-containing protein n=1 Tax=Spirosoma fluviale TaxID=1597977 RepID=A0A286GXE2_9BACT|nr:hypothetical protein [Spirosoma fluviale]SOD99724.1 hypothetical protein SAMN06269250_0130 [Spirosoma fluviale]